MLRLRPFPIAIVVLEIVDEQEVVPYVRRLLIFSFRDIFASSGVGTMVRGPLMGIPNLSADE